MPLAVTPLNHGQSARQQANRDSTRREPPVFRSALGECTLGSILVAATDVGLCALFLADHREHLIEALPGRFSRAQFISDDPALERCLAKAIALVENPNMGLDVPLDLHGTAFQQRVWKALREISLDKTASYKDIAEKIGQPTATRAVRTDGSLSGYRWGVERKAKLLERERTASTNS